MLHIIQNITVALYQQNQQEITLIQEVTLVAESVSRNYQHIEGGYDSQVV